MNICVIHPEDCKIRMCIDRKVALHKSYMSKDLKRAGNRVFIPDPCEKCLISPVCTYWCDEKNDYLWGD